MTCIIKLTPKFCENCGGFRREKERGERNEKDLCGGRMELNFGGRMS